MSDKVHLVWKDAPFPSSSNMAESVLGGWREWLIVLAVLLESVNEQARLAGGLIDLIHTRHEIDRCHRGQGLYMVSSCSSAGKSTASCGAASLQAPGKSTRACAVCAHGKCSRKWTQVLLPVQVADNRSV